MYDSQSTGQYLQGANDYAGTGYIIGVAVGAIFDVGLFAITVYLAQYLYCRAHGKKVANDKALSRWGIALSVCVPVKIVSSIMTIPPLVAVLIYEAIAVIIGINKGKSWAALSDKKTTVKTIASYKIGGKVYTKEQVINNPKLLDAVQKAGYDI